jgi:hypothetical protein
LHHSRIWGVSGAEHITPFAKLASLFFWLTLVRRTTHVRVIFNFSLLALGWLACSLLGCERKNKLNNEWDCLKMEQNNEISNVPRRT